MAFFLILPSWGQDNAAQAQNPAPAPAPDNNAPAPATDNNAPAPDRPAQQQPLQGPSQLQGPGGPGGPGNGQGFRPGGQGGPGGGPGGGQGPGSTVIGDRVSLQFPLNPVNDILNIYERLIKKPIVKDSTIFNGPQVSLVTPAEVSVQEAIRLIEAALLVNGYVLVVDPEDD
ncbi:MAG: hypothetical protein KDN18_12535, partial [Verrucomicrobiae bacterium]|nr:hypothetical protein [Verrucomicrobiae bacterium]